MVEISTSVLSVKKEESLKTFYNIETAGTNYFHIDVMDGDFVENNTDEIMYENCSNLKQITNIPLDIHFMVKDIKEYIERYIAFEPSIITFHIEAVQKDEILDTINYIKENGVKVGIAISPKTNVQEVYEYLPYINLVLVMTVEPGKGGQTLIEDTIDKVKELKEHIKNNELETYIEVDGGITLDNSNILKTNGAEILVVGNTIVKSENYKEIMEKLKTNN